MLSVTVYTVLTFVNLGKYYPNPFWFWVHQGIFWRKPHLSRYLPPGKRYPGLGTKICPFSKRRVFRITYIKLWIPGLPIRSLLWEFVKVSYQEIDDLWRKRTCEPLGRRDSSRVNCAVISRFCWFKCGVSSSSAEVRNWLLCCKDRGQNAANTGYIAQV